jgi:hypothetical protein
MKKARRAGASYEVQPAGRRNKNATEEDVISASLSRPEKRFGRLAHSFQWHPQTRQSPGSRVQKTKKGASDVPHPQWQGKMARGKKTIVPKNVRDPAGQQDFSPSAPSYDFGRNDVLARKARHVPKRCYHRLDLRVTISCFQKAGYDVRLRCEPTPKFDPAIGGAAFRVGDLAR